MTNSSPTSLRQLIELNDDSDDVQKAQKLIDSLTDIVRTNHAAIQSLTNVETLVSLAAVSECWDSLAVMRQIAAALDLALKHHTATESLILVDSFERALGRVNSALRGAEKEMATLRALVER